MTNYSRDLNFMNKQKAFEISKKDDILDSLLIKVWMAFSATNCILALKE